MLLQLMLCAGICCAPDKTRSLCGASSSRRHKKATADVWSTGLSAEPQSGQVSGETGSSSQPGTVWHGMEG